MPWADCRSGISELVGEDPFVIIRIDANQLMVEISRCCMWLNYVSAWIVVAIRFGIVCLPSGEPVLVCLHTL